MRILIVGGYGVFGGRLARLLRAETNLELIVAGRSKAKADRFCQLYANSHGASMIPRQLDREAENLADELARMDLDMVVDASGPFQAYGQRAYRLVRTCLELGLHYLDIADGRDFVVNIEQFDGQAKKAGVAMISGLSSVPALSGTVLNKIASDFHEIRKIKGGIAPSPKAGVGINVIRAITAYAGDRLVIDPPGEKAQETGSTTALVRHWRQDIAPTGSGEMDLNNRLFALVDVPGNAIFLKEILTVEKIEFGAGPVPEIFLKMLIFLAWLRSKKWLPNLTKFAVLFNFVIRFCKWGPDRGGMVLEIEGLSKAGAQDKRSFHLIAHGADGPFIPSMACAIMIRKFLNGAAPASGARHGGSELQFEEFTALFENFRITWSIKDGNETILFTNLIRQQ